MNWLQFKVNRLFNSLDVNEPTFAAAKIKLELPPKFTGKPFELSGWLFSVE